ncbi:hypothetical protein ACS8YF_13535 [Salinisphaera sp. SWV1]|uniref:hypothetical protein n=1 Tax=Salinisphaera sp. SWV1 TaxID=3454139 RepID=UPI003F840C86
MRPSQPPSRHDTLSTYLKHAADDLAHASPPLDHEAEGLLFLGAWHQSYPAILVRDPFLSDSAKVHFLYLMQESSCQPRGAIAMPSLDQTAQVLGHSRKTVNRDRTLLRVCRWISRYTHVRDNQGRFCGSINAIHSEPCSLAEASRLDTSYLPLLDSAKNHSDRYIKRAAKAALASIDQTLADGRDPLEPPDPISRRLDAATAVQNGGGTFFDLLLSDGGRITKPDDPTESVHPMASNFGDEYDSQQERFTHGEPWVEFTHGDSRPWVDFTNGRQAADKKDNNISYPQTAKFTHGYSSSSSNNKTTTTDISAREAVSAHGSSGHSVGSRSSSEATAEAGPALHWPDALPSNERALIERNFASQALSGDQQQQVLDVIARKLQDPDNPLRSPVGYAVTLCQRVRSGHFQPVGAPERKPDRRQGAPKPEPDGPAAELDALRQRLQAVQSEIDGLEQHLIPFAPTESRPDLETQRECRCQERDALKQRYRAIRAQLDGVRDSST